MNCACLGFYICNECENKARFNRLPRRVQTHLVMYADALEKQKPEAINYQKEVLRYDATLTPDIIPKEILVSLTKK